MSLALNRDFVIISETSDGKLLAAGGDADRRVPEFRRSGGASIVSVKIHDCDLESLLSHDTMDHRALG